MAPGTKIIVDPGLYTKPLVITKPGITLEAKDMDGNVQISLAAGPAITVNYTSGDPVILKGIKIIHTGVQPRLTKNAMYNNEIETVALRQHERLHSLSKSLTSRNLGESGSILTEASDTGKHVDQWVGAIKVREDMSCGILVLNGNVYCDEVGVSMSSTKIGMPAVVSSGGHITLENCEIKGHGTIPTVGVFCLNSDLTMLGCKIHRHRGGGIILRSTP